MRRRAIQTTPTFPSFVEDKRRQRIEDHKRTMRMCWPNWDGDLSVGAPIDCGSAIAHLAEPVTLWGKEMGVGCPFYAMSVPCRILEVVDDETFIAAIDYSPEDLERNAWARHHQGIKLRLDILDVWVPYDRLT